MTSLALTPAVLGTFSVSVTSASYSALVFSICTPCHGELDLLRPNARHLTLFYLLVALGGALGGTFASVVAPAFFGGMWELQVGVVAAWLLVTAAWWVDRESPVHSGDRRFFAGPVALVCVLARVRLGLLPAASIGWVASHSWAATLAATAVGRLPSAPSPGSGQSRSRRIGPRRCCSC